MRKIYVDTSLFYYLLPSNIQKSILQFIKTCTHKHRPYMAPFAIKRNVNNCKGAVFNHNSRNVTVVYPVLLQ